MLQTRSGANWNLNYTVRISKLKPSEDENPEFLNQTYCEIPAERHLYQLLDGIKDDIAER